MQHKIEEIIEIPKGISCEIVDSSIICKTSTTTLSHRISSPHIKALIAGNTIKLICEKGNKRQFKEIKSHIAHIKNLFEGAQHPFVYTLEACNVHFPMTLKVEGEKVVINNFLGERTPRSAKIFPSVNVEIKGAKITVSAHNRELAGQTAAAIERATKVRSRDRRVFQDGIFIVSRPGRISS